MWTICVGMEEMLLIYPTCLVTLHFIVGSFSFFVILPLSFFRCYWCCALYTGKCQNWSPATIVGLLAHWYSGHPPSPSVLYDLLTFCVVCYFSCIVYLAVKTNHPESWKLKLKVEKSSLAGWSTLIRCSQVCPRNQSDSFSWATRQLSDPYIGYHLLTESTSNFPEFKLPKHRSSS